MEKDMDELLERVINVLCSDNINKMEIKNVRTNNKDVLCHNMDNMPEAIIFNGDYTVLKYEDEDITLKKSEEDENDPIYAFLYGFFIRQSGLKKERAKEVLQIIERIGKDRKEVKLDEIEKLLDENLDLESYFKKFKEIINKN
jgi:hypothetical protein